MVVDGERGGLDKTQRGNFLGQDSKLIALQIYAQWVKDLNERLDPHPAQKAVISAVFSGKYKLIVVRAGRKFGKSTVVNYCAARQSALGPNQQTFIFAPQKIQAKKLYWTDGRLRKQLPKKYIKHVDNQELRLTYVNDSFIWLAGADDPDADRGINPDFVAIDELKDIKPEFMEAQIPNLASKNATLLAIGTPPQQMFIGPEEKHPFLLLEEEAEARSDGIVFHFTSYENPHLPPGFLEQQKRILEARGEWDVWQREYLAEYTQGGKNAVFPMLSKQQHVFTHADLMLEVHKDRHKLDWYLVCDPGSTTVFAALFVAINRHTNTMYVLDEIYEKEREETATGKIVPRMQQKIQDLHRHERHWVRIYDEAAAWFANEAMEQFGIAFGATHKSAAGTVYAEDTKPGLSQIKNALLADKLKISDKCPNLFFELRNYIKVNGRLPKINDHTIDCLRYAVYASNFEVSPYLEPEPPTERRMFSLEEDLENIRSGGLSQLLEDL